MNPIMRTDKGFYYSNNAFSELGLCYYDAKNGKSMYLCNKPECRHDGNEFCAATSDKYRTMGTVMYSGSLYINVLEETDTSYQYKLLRASLDGSSLSEVVTYFELDNVGVVPVYFNEISRSMAIHRNKVFLPYRLANTDNSGVGYTGTAIYDMETKEITSLGEIDESLETWVDNFCGYGDYMYFITANGYKKELFRYSYTDASVEKVELGSGFMGSYAVYDDNTIFFTKKPGELYVYKYDTGKSTAVENEEWLGLWSEVRTENGLEYQKVTTPSLDSVTCDGEYVYVPENYSLEQQLYPLTVFYHEINGEREEIVFDYAEINILDGEGKYVNQVKVSAKEFLGYDECFLLHFTEDAVYIQTPIMVYECSKEDFIAGNANFKEACSLEMGIYGREENEE